MSYKPTLQGTFVYQGQINKTCFLIFFFPQLSLQCLQAVVGVADLMHHLAHGKGLLLLETQEHPQGSSFNELPAPHHVHAIPEQRG